jgi:hypothetical protein
LSSFSYEKIVLNLDGDIAEKYGLRRFSYGINATVVKARVTRLGKFLPIGRLFSLGSFIKTTFVSKNGLLFIKVIILTKMGWPTF